MSEWTKQKCFDAEILNISKNISIGISPQKKAGEFEINLMGQKSIITGHTLESAKTHAMLLMKIKLEDAIKQL